jgi:hypothetical protein
MPTDVGIAAADRRRRRVVDARDTPESSDGRLNILEQADLPIAWIHHRDDERV